MKKKKKAFITASDLNAEKKRINLTLGIDMVEKLIGIGNQLYPSINPTTVATLILCSSICDLHGKCKGNSTLPGQQGLFKNKTRKVSKK